MGRRIKTHLPVLPSLLEVDSGEVVKREENIKARN